MSVVEAFQVWVKRRGGSFLLTGKSFYLQLVFVAYSQLAWSFLLTVEFRFGLFCLQW